MTSQPLVPPVIPAPSPQPATQPPSQPAPQQPQPAPQPTPQPLPPVAQPQQPAGPCNVGDLLNERIVPGQGRAPCNETLGQRIVAGHAAQGRECSFFRNTRINPGRDPAACDLFAGRIKVRDAPEGDRCKVFGATVDATGRGRRKALLFDEQPLNVPPEEAARMVRDMEVLVPPVNELYLTSLASDETRAYLVDSIYVLSRAADMKKFGMTLPLATRKEIARTYMTAAKRSNGSTNANVARGNLLTTLLAVAAEDVSALTRT